MADTDPLAGIDGPRALPDALRRRLEERLLASEPRALDTDLADRLSESLSPSSAEAGHLGAGTNRARVAGGIAAAVVLVGGVVGVALHSSGHHRSARVSSSATAGLSGRAVAGSAAGATSRAEAPALSVPSPYLQQSRGSSVASGGAGSTSSGTAHAPAVSGVSTVASVVPAQGPVGGGTWVTIGGSNLGSVSGVSFGGTPATRVVVVSPTSLRALTPAHPAGPVPVRVVTGSGDSDPVTFTFTQG